MSSKSGKTERLWNLSFTTILLFDVMYQLGAYMLNTVIAVYAIGLGATYGIAGLLAGLNSGTALAVRPITGFISDVLSKKTLLVSSAVLFLIATIGCAAFDSMVLIGLCRIIQGISFALRSVCVVALASKVIPQEKLNRGMGWIGLSTVIALGVGPLFSDHIGLTLGFHASFWIATVLLAVCVGLAFSLRVPAAVQQQEKRLEVNIKQLRDCFHLDSFIYRPSIVFSLMSGLAGVPIGIVIPLLILAAEQRGIEGAPLFFAVYAITSFIGRPIVGRISDNIGARKVILPLFFVEFVSTVLLMVMQNTWMMFLAALLMGIGEGCLYPLLQAESVRGVESKELGRAANTFYICPDINMCVSPIIGSLLLGAFGVAVMFGYAVVGVVVGALIYIVWLKRHEGKTQGAKLHTAKPHGSSSANDSSS